MSLLQGLGKSLKSLEPSPMLIRMLLLAVLTILPSYSHAQEDQPAPLDVGSKRILFLDDWVIDKLDGARRRLHQPIPREKVLTLDKPWEGIYSGYFSVFQDGHRYRMYYRGMPEAKHDLDTEVTCYAESLDGIHWTKPSLGHIEVMGTSENNLILSRHRACHNFSPFLDTNPDAKPEAKYKAVGGTGSPGLVALRSPDGIEWTDIQTAPVITKGAFDSQNVAFWSESEKCYVCYFRFFREGTRWIARSTSQDFVQWSEPVEMEADGRPYQHLYTNQIVPYPRAPHLYIGFPTRFMPGRRVLTAEQMKELGTATGFDFRNDCADIQIVSTRGGTALNRHWMGAYVRPGLDAKNWTSRANYAAQGIVQTGPQELSIYVLHHVGYPTNHIRRYTLRPDGFASVYAPFSGGECVSKPFSFEGNSLTLNSSTSAAGGIRVEIQDADGQAIEGFELANCSEIIGDTVQRHVIWKEGGDISRLAGTSIRLRFALKDAEVFAFKVVNKEFPKPEPQTEEDEE